MPELQDRLLYAIAVSYGAIVIGLEGWFKPDLRRMGTGTLCCSDGYSQSTLALSRVANIWSVMADHIL
jgi:hypothetical protein